MIAVIIIFLLVVSLEAVYYKLCSQNIPRMIERFRLGETGFFDKRFSGILHAFLTGNNTALNLFSGMRSLKAYLNDHFEPYFRGFAFEGTGMGLGARAEKHFFWKGRSFERYIHKLDPNHIYQYYVGLGWWLHTRYEYRAEGYRSWLKRLDPYYAPILFDGVGFKTGLFDSGKESETLRRFTSFHPDEQRVCYQGFGRSLWFANKFEIEPVLMEMEQFPDYCKNDMFSGLGLAVAYSMFDNISVVMNAFRQIPEARRAAFAQGMAFGWEARRLQNREYWDATLDKFTPPLKDKLESWVAIVHKARELAGTIDPKTHYIRWMDITRSMLRNQIAEEGN